MTNDNYDVSNLNARCMQGYGVRNLQVAQYNPRLLGDVNFRGELAQDQFEKSSGGSGFGTLITSAALGGAAGAATGFTLLGNPIEKTKDGLKVKDAFWKTYDKATYDGLMQTEINCAKNEALKEFGVTLNQYEAVEKLAKAKNLESLSDEVKNALPKEIQTPEAAQELVAKAEPKFQAIDMAKITENVDEAFKQSSVQRASDRVKNFTTLEERIKTLKPDATKDEIKAFLEENKSLLGVKDEAKLAKHLEFFGELNQQELLKEIQNIKAVNAESVAKHTENVLKNVEKESGKLVEGAEKEMTKLFGKFKMSQLQKYGIWGAVAGATLGLFSLLGGKDNA